MFKAVLVIFVLGIGKGDNQKGGNLTVTPFQSMAQCEQAIGHINTVTNKWYYGDDKTAIVPILKTVKCYPIDEVPLNISTPDFTVQAPECSPSVESTHTIPEAATGWGKEPW